MTPSPFLRVLSRGWGWYPQSTKSSSQNEQELWGLTGPGVLVLFPPVAQSLMCRTVMPSSLHLWATSWTANMAANREDSSASAFTFILPITQQMVSLPERWVPWTKICQWGMQRCGRHQIHSLLQSVHLRSNIDDLFFLLCLPLARCHFWKSSPYSSTGAQTSFFPPLFRKSHTVV